MAHNHHHHHSEIDASLKRVYIISIALNLGFVFVEAAMGLRYDSLGLLSDAGHNLSDVFSLLLAFVAFGLMSSKARKGFTYGYRKSSVLISLLNAVILLVAVGAIVVESIAKFRNPMPVNGTAISWTAGIGILVNGLTTYLLMSRRKKDINTRGAFLHMLADTLVSVGVMLSGIIINLTGWTIIDPIISIVIAAIILIGTWDLLGESLRMSIDAVPEGIDADAIKYDIEAIAGKGNVHHIHIWPISTTETALTAHIVVSELTDALEKVSAIKAMLASKGIAHSTIELESEGGECDGKSCC